MKTTGRIRRRASAACGSPTRQVAAILVAVARRHRGILADSVPVAIFEDFGADALVLSLDFWMEVHVGVDGRVQAMSLGRAAPQSRGSAGHRLLIESAPLAPATPA